MKKNYLFCSYFRHISLCFYSNFNWESSLDLEFDSESNDYPQSILFTDPATPKTRNKEQVKNIKHIVPPNPKEKQGTPPVWSPILLRRKNPMAWGTTTNRVTAEINPFLYARETKHLTLKDLDFYLISDSWCRSPLNICTPTCIGNLLPQDSTNKTHMLYIIVLDLLWHI